MKKTILTLILMSMAQSTFAIDTTSKTVVSLAVEVVFSTAITTGSSDILSFSASEARKLEARKVQAEVQDYSQTGHITIFLGEKISILQSMDSSLSLDESVDALLAASELILK